MASCCDGKRPYLSLKIDYLPEPIVARARRELGETDEVKARTFQEMKQLISQEPNFVCPTYDDYLLMFLRPRKFDVDRAFELLQASWGVKKKYPDLYSECDEEALLRTFRLNCVYCLPYRDENGAVIMIVKLKNWDPDVSTADEFVVALTYVCFACAVNPVTQVCGIRLLIDVGGMYFKQGRRLTSTFLLIIANALKATIPARWVGIHIYNESVIWPMLWVIIKGFLSEKLRSRIHFHGSKAEELHDFFPKEILPVEYGGDNKEDICTWYITEEVEKFMDTYREIVKDGYRT